MNLKLGTEYYNSLKVHFHDSKGALLKTVECNEGDSLLDLAHEHDIDLEGTYHFYWPHSTSAS